MKSVTTKQQEQFISSSSSSSSTITPIDQRKWNDIPVVGNIDAKSFKISKQMIRMLRHQGHPRQNDWAIEWRRLLPMFCRDHLDAQKWTNQMWIGNLQRRSDKKRLEHCLDSNRNNLYMRAIRGHSGRNKVDRPLQDDVEIPFIWTEYTYPVEVLLMIVILISNQVWLHEEKIRRKEDKRYSSQPWILCMNHERMSFMTWQHHDRYLAEPDGKSTRTQYIGKCTRTRSKVFKTKDWHSGKLDPMLSSFITPFQSTVLKKW